MNRSRSIIVVVVCLGLLIIGACGDDSNPTPTLRNSTASSTEDGGTAIDSTPRPDSGGGGGGNDGGADAAPLGPDESGEATYYNADGTGACGFKPSTDFMVCAINDEQYSKANCGRCVSVKGPKGTVVVRIVDMCPGCGPGDLDLSETAFTKIADKSAGRIKITWHFVACP